MTDHLQEASAEGQEAGAEDGGKPVGAMFLALAFLVLVVILWLWTYAELLGRT